MPITNNIVEITPLLNKTSSYTNRISVTATCKRHPTNIGVNKLDENMNAGKLTLDTFQSLATPITQTKNVIEYFVSVLK